MEGGHKVVTGGRGEKQGIQQSRWRTDGSDYQAILRDGGRRAGRLGNGEINSKEKVKM